MSENDDDEDEGDISDDDSVVIPEATDLRTERRRKRQVSNGQQGRFPRSLYRQRDAIHHPIFSLNIFISLSIMT